MAIYAGDENGSAYGNSHEDPQPGVTPWRDANGVWHFGGSESRGGGGTGAGVPPSSTPPATTPPPGGVTPPVPPVPGFDWKDFFTQMGGGLLSGLGSIFGQQKRQSFQGTEADPVQALAGVQRNIGDFGSTLNQRASAPVTLTNDGVRRNTGAPMPTAQDYEHLKSTLRSMGVNL